MMKRITGILLIVLMIFALTACGNFSEPGNSEFSSMAEVTSPYATNPESSVTDAISSATPAASSVGTGNAHRESNTEDELEAKSSVLVAYFSCTGTTKPLAEYAAEILGADLYEIVPETPYAGEDLNYGNSSSRAAKEQNDPNARPAISGPVKNMNEYDTILLAYPIWWGQAPRIISTFLESYDFSEKTIVPLCTSHSSGIGRSAENLHALCPDNTVWEHGIRFASGTTKNEINQWLSQIDIGNQK